MDIINFDGKKVGSIDLPANVFAVPVRADLMQRAVLWQQAGMRAGLANTKTRGEINRTKKKMYGQKGTGNARHGAASPSLFRGGGVTFGPRPRDFSTTLPKRIRQQALASALSSKMAAGNLVIIDEARLATMKTKAFADQLAALKWGGQRASIAFIVDSLDDNFDKASRNIPHLKVLPTEGANVLDILKHETLVMTQHAVQLLASRLDGKAAVNEAPSQSGRAGQTNKAAAKSSAKSTGKMTAAPAPAAVTPAAALAKKPAARAKKSAE